MNPSLLALLAIVLVLALLMLAGITQLNRKRSGLDREYFNKRWQDVMNHRSHGGTGVQFSILEADKLVDAALKQSGFGGKTMGERLKDARNTLSDNDGIWKAHKLRNRLAHEHDIKITGIAADLALKSFRAALKDLGAL